MFMPSHCSTMFHRWCCMLWIMSCSKSSPILFLPVILVQVDLNFSHPLFQKLSAFLVVFLAKSNLALFEPSCIALVKSSLDCRLWQWHAYLLESVLPLAGCCERGFFTIGEDPPIIHHVVSVDIQVFYVAELTSAFFFFRLYQTVDLEIPNVPAISLMDVFCFWSLTIVCFTCMESSFDCMMWVQSISFQIWHN